MIRILLSRYNHMNWTLADQVMVSGVNFLTGLLLARFLGLGDFGVFTLLWMGVLFINSIQLAMVVSPMMSIGPKQSEEIKGAYYSALMIQQLIFSVLTFAFLFFGLTLIGLLKTEWALTSYALPLAFAGVFFQSQDFIRRYFFCQNAPAAAFWNDCISYLGQIVVIIYLFLNGGLSVAKVLWVVGITSALAVALGVIKLKFERIGFDDFKGVMLRNWGVSKWLSASAVLQWFSGNLFIVTAGAVLGSSVVGGIKAAQNIIGVAHIIFQGLENIVPVKASLALTNQGVGGLLQYLKKVTVIGSLVMVFVCFFMIVFSNDLMIIVYGDVFKEYGVALQWYSVIYVFVFFCLPLRAGLRALETTRPIFIAYIIMTIFSLSFATALVERLGLNGALLGVLVTQVIMVISLSTAFYYQGKTHYGKIQ